MQPIKSPKKLIEAALPLDAINAAAAREKSIRHGHPSTLHLWWARRPLAAARAVIFAQMVNDPGYKRQYQRGLNKEAAAEKREELFNLLVDLVQWENTSNEEVLQKAREAIMESWRETCYLNRDHPQAQELFNPEKLPAFHDPFAGGGALPLEAQRLGLEAWASDLNPVAVTINKAMIEIPPKFADRAPVGPVPPSTRHALSMPGWKGAQGLAEDVRRYGHWMREEARKRIGHLYPQVEITADMAADRPDLQALVGQKLTVIAWIWARTVKSPNPAFAHVSVPLASTFVLSSKSGREAWVEPVVTGDTYRFTVRMGKPPEEAKNGTTAGKRKAFFCLLSHTPLTYDYIRQEGQAGRIGQKLMAIVAEGKNGRIYLSPSDKQISIAQQAHPIWTPNNPLPHNPRDFKTPNYGLTTFGDLFTPRQLVALTTFSDLVQEAIALCHSDARNAGMEDDPRGLEEGGTGAKAYAEAVGVYLGLAVDRLAMTGNSLVRWNCVGQKAQHCFGRQSLPMLWDFAEPNFLGTATGSIDAAISCSFDPLYLLGRNLQGKVHQTEAQIQNISSQKILSTDPPYYDNIGYADLSDFFYVWLRRSLRPVFPTLYGTMSVPKAEELVATPYRHGGKDAAEHFFMDGMTQAIRNLAEQAHPAFPVTIYYAFKQSETKKDEGTSSTGWETFLAAVLEAGFAITGTWPIRTEMQTRQIASGTNALASSIVLVCRRRAADAISISRREFLRELNEVMPVAFEEMTRGGVNSPVAPVDLSQAIIGPGMAVFSKYKAVLEADGSPMSVRTALRIINRFFGDEDFDNDTMFCLGWFDGNGWAAGKFGDADVLARAKGTSAAGLVEAGVAASGGGQVRLLRWQEMPDGWDPARDARNPVWEALHQLIRSLNLHGEQHAGRLLAKCGSRSGAIRALAYRLYTLCERKGWADDARAYNELVVAWTNIEQASLKENAADAHIEQGSLM